PVRRGVLLAEAPGDGAQFRLRLAWRRPALEPAHGVQEMRAPRLREGGIASERERYPELHGLGRDGEDESLRHHANDRIVGGIEPDGLAHDRAIAAQLALPQLVAQHRFAIAMWQLLL